jgi:hypothetical protein
MIPPPVFRLFKSMIRQRRIKPTTFAGDGKGEMVGLKQVVG